jgi:hypothetical protein
MTIADSYLAKMESASNLERIKLITAHIVATLQFFTDGLKPFNPILGETFQCKIGDTEIYVEQTSHHPPIFNYLFKHPKFTMYGCKGAEVSMGANSVTVENPGKLYLQLKDGTLYRTHLGTLSLSGISIGRRLLNFSGIYIEDLVKLICLKIRHIT